MEEIQDKEITLYDAVEQEVVGHDRLKICNYKSGCGYKKMYHCYVF